MSSAVCYLLLAAILYFSAISASAQSNGGIGDPCILDSACQVPNSYCGNRISCSCLPNFTYNTRTGSCEQDECNTDAECQTYDNTVCKERYCVCGADYVASRNDNHTCLLAAHYDQPCEEEHQCQDSNTYCSHGTCQCKPDSIRKQNTCLNTHNIDNCYSNSMCNDKYPNTHCMNRTCVCNKGFVESSRDKYSCLPEEYFNGACQESVQCIDDDNFCDDGICKIKPESNA
ncbi:hypothetical protein L9F63_019850, partial [Diploptera punctata]